MVTLDEPAIRRIRLRTRVLRHDHGLSKRKISRIIAQEFNLPFNTVRYYAFIIGKDWRRHTLKGKRYDNKYDLKYKRVIRHIDNLLPRVFNGNSELQLKEISNGIENLAGISLKERTLEKLLGKYERLPRGSPIIKAEPGNYRLNTSFYNF